MSEIKIQDLLCYARVEGELSPGVTLVTGPNSAGKSCFATILAALAAHDSNPLHASVSAAKSVYVRDGQIEGNASLEGRQWRPPKGISIPNDEEPLSKPHAVGLVHFTETRSAPERAKLWEGLFLPEDAGSVLRPHWHLSEQQLVSVLKTIERDGWNEAQKDYERKRREAGRQWGEATGEKYGTKKAVNWVPANWNAELEGKSEADMVYALSNAQDQLRLITTARAIEQKQIDDAIHARDVLIPEQEKNMDAAQIDASMIAETLKVKEDKFGDLNLQAQSLQKKLKLLLEQKDSPKPDASCPHCGGGLAIQSDGSLEKWLEPSESEKEELENKISRFKEQAQQIKPAVEMAEEDVGKTRAELLQAEERMREHAWEVKRLKKVAEMADAEPSEGVDEGARSAAENAIESAKDDHKMWNQWRDAGKSQESYLEYDAVCSLLGPNGARAQLMKSYMDKVSIVLESIHQRTGWKHEVRVSDDYSITSGGRLIALCAQNEKLKAQWSLQIAVGMLTKSKYIVLDQADLLDKDSWGGLKDLVNSFIEKKPDVHLVVCGTELEVDGWPTWRLTSDHAVMPANG